MNIVNYTKNNIIFDYLYKIEIEIMQERYADYLFL